MHGPTCIFWAKLTRFSLQDFGSTYSFAIKDTVAEGHAGGDGSVEFIALLDAQLLRLAAEAGLEAVTDYDDLQVGNSPGRRYRFDRK
jgi:hypothetical protein